MNPSIKLLLLFFWLTPAASIGQVNLNAADAADAKPVDNTDAPAILARQLMTSCRTDSEKVVSIFSWITENIGYDTKGYYNLNSIYKGLFQWADGVDSVTAYTNYNENIVKKVLREKVAICDGYTRLFKTLCDLADIKSEIVIGYVRWHSDTIGVHTNRIHAWNAVEIDGKWHLLDATWGSGFSNTQVTKFKKDYDPYYFLTPPGQMINDHFPLDSNWQLLSRPVTISAFYNQPYLFPAFVKSAIKSFKPSKGVVEAAAGEKILFQLEMDEPQQQLVVLSSLTADSSVFFAPLNRVSEGIVACEYKIPAGEQRQLYLVYKGELVMRYELRPKPKLPE